MLSKICLCQMSLLQLIHIIWVCLFLFSFCIHQMSLAEFVYDEFTWVCLHQMGLSECLHQMSLQRCVNIRWVWVGLFISDECLSLFTLNESTWVCLHHSLRGFVYIRWVWVGLFTSDETSLESEQFCLHQRSPPEFAYIKWDDKGPFALDESTLFCFDQMSHPALVYIRWVINILLFTSDESSYIFCLN